MIKFLQFAFVFLFSMIFVITFPVFILATKPFVSLQYALLPHSIDQKNMAQESLAVLTSFQKSAAALSRFTSIKQSNQILPLYTPLEVDHLVDVKKRFDIVRLAAIASFILLFCQACVFKSIEFKKQMYTSSILGVLMVLAIGAMLFASWDWFFVTFHTLLFPAGNWSFSETSGLIQLFPEIFWFRFGVAWITIIVLMLLTTTLISRSMINRSSRN